MKLERRNLAKFFREQGADIEYYEAPGIHNWSYWIPAAEKGIQFLLKKYKTEVIRLPFSYFLYLS